MFKRLNTWSDLVAGVRSSCVIWASQITATNARQ